MSKVYFISDMHFGHKKILNFAGRYRDGSTVAEHNQILVDKWNSIVTKRDLVYVLGDVAFSVEDFFKYVPQLKGMKILVRGNHDELNAKTYLEVFHDVMGCCKYKGYWLSHFPMHLTELRGRKNIHGHVHMSTIRDRYHNIDPGYVNVCVEACNGFPVPFEQIENGIYVPRV